MLEYRWATCLELTGGPRSISRTPTELHPKDTEWWSNQRTPRDLVKNTRLPPKSIPNNIIIISHVQS